MSMRNYGVETNGLVITRYELHELLLKNDNEILRNILSVERINDIDDYDIDDFIDDFINDYKIDNTTSFYEIDGKLYNIDNWGEKELYDGETIVITELKKDTLYDKYNSFDEIKQELKDNYKQVGIELDDEFIEKHFGRFSGLYYG